MVRRGQPFWRILPWRLGMRVRPFDCVLLVRRPVFLGEWMDALLLISIFGNRQAIMTAVNFNSPLKRPD